MSCLALATLMGNGPGAHPIHTTFTDLRYSAAGQSMNLRIRAFVDDFSAAAAAFSSVRPGRDHSIPDSIAFRYVRNMVQLRDAAGRIVPLDWCGTHRNAEVVWLCLQGGSGVAPKGYQVRNALLFDRFDDQVNVVQATLHGMRQTIFFTRNDGFKRLR